MDSFSLLSLSLYTHAQTHTNESPRNQYISEHGIELIRSHPVSWHTDVTKQERGKTVKLIGGHGRMEGD